MGTEGMAAKFTDCAKGVLPKSKISAALDAIYHVDDMADVSKLVEAVAV